MKATYIDYSDTNSFSKTLLSYLSDEAGLKSFYGNRPDFNGFADQIKSKSSFSEATREVLVEELLQSYGEMLGEDSLVRQNILSLKGFNSFTVTTGHQLNIFTGPLYFIFKIVTAIKLAQDLKAEFPEYHFVPVYWMATEDHDFDEINHTRVYGKKISWDTEKISGTGRMSTADMGDVVKQYVRMLGLSENSSKLSEMVNAAYRSGLNLADATRVLVHSLFSEYGLVIVDADRVRLKTEFVPIIKEDIIHGRSFAAISSTSEQLEELGYRTQVHAREINFFYLTDEFRERIVTTEDGRYEVLNRGLYFTEQELIDEIDGHPDRFSPNVVMRPLYQEVIMPNLAYIGGGAEIVYWLQLKKNFDQYEIPFPILVPRNSAIVTDDSTVSKIFRLDLTMKSIFKPLDVLTNEYVRRNTKHRLNLRDEWMELNAIFAKLKLRIHKIDPTLGPSSEAVKARLKKAINKLEKKLIKADKKNYQDGLLQIGRIKEQFFPGGGLQERSENFATLYLKYGDDFVRQLLLNFKPLDFKFTIIYG